MKNKIFKKVFIVIGIFVLLFPLFMETANAHWAETDIAYLSRNYELGSVFTDRDLDDSIRIEDFQYLVGEVLDIKYDGVPDAITREALVYELSKIWAEQAGRDLETVPVIMMLIYSDTDEIDLKYRHGVTVAYMIDIAKGKAPGIFDPEAEVTYGELAVLINNTKRAIDNEIKNQSSQLKNEEQGLEKEGLETKGSYQIKDDKIVFDFELINHYPEEKELQFSSGQQFEIVIRDENDKEVYRYSEGKFFTMALIYKDIDSGDSLKWQDEWDMRDEEGKKASSGKYLAEIEIIATVDEKEEKIEDSQLRTIVEFALMRVDQYSANEDSQDKTGDRKSVV